MAQENTSHERFGEREQVKPPSEKSFGITIGCALAIIGAVSAWRHGLNAVQITLFAAAAAFIGAAFLFASILKPLNILWMKFGLVLHKVVNPIILGLLFYVVFVPMGLIMRMAGVDFLRTRQKMRPQSYWVLRGSENLAESSMKNQF
jgi:hypothetical protein